MTRTCTKCGATKPATTEHFNRHGKYLRPDCKLCHRAADRAYAAANREKINAKAAAYRAARREELARKSREYHQANRETVLAKMRASGLKHEYGLSPEQYQALFDSQGGVCAYCERPPRAKSLCVDHDHDTGRVRGLLCPPCNTALGRLGDSEAGLRRAIEYLRDAPARIASVLPDGPEFEAKSRRYNAA